MVYIVTGLYRSGTSMMMRCLQMGGMKAHWEVDTDELTHDYDSGYHPNPNGFFQFSGEVDALYDGMVIKPDFRELLGLEGDYKTILMKRNPSEIRRSLERTFPESREVAADFYDLVFPAIKERLPSVTVVDYSEVVEEPERVFGRLRSEGWPVTLEAVRGVDETLYRHREVV